MRAETSVVETLRVRVPPEPDDVRLVEYDSANDSVRVRSCVIVGGRVTVTQTDLDALLALERDKEMDEVTVSFDNVTWCVTLEDLQADGDSVVELLPRGDDALDDKLCVTGDRNKVTVDDACTSLTVCDAENVISFDNEHDRDTECVLSAVAVSILIEFEADFASWDADFDADSPSALLLCDKELAELIEDAHDTVPPLADKVLSLVDDTEMDVEELMSDVMDALGGFGDAVAVVV